MKKEKNKYILIIIILIILLIASIIAGTVIYINKPVQGATAVIQKQNEELTDNSGGRVRIKINPFVTVKDNTMQNLNFCNYNEDRLLKCKLKLKDSYIYESVLLQEGSLLEGDFVDTTKLKKGENEVLAEVYSYNTDGTLMGQTNVIIVLNLI